MYSKSRMPIFLFGLTLLLTHETLAQTPDHTGEVPTPVPLKVLVKDTDSISVFRVTKVEEKDFGTFRDHIVSYKKVTDLKGNYPTDVLRLSLSGVGKPEALLARTKPRDEMVFFCRGGPFHAHVKPGQKPVFQKGHKALSYFGGLWCYNWDFGGEGPIWSTSDGMIDGKGFQQKAYSGSIDDLQKRVRALEDELGRKK